MTKTLIIVLSVIGAIALLAIGFALGVAGSRGALASTVYDISNLVGDVYQGMNHTLTFQNGVFVGVMNTSGNVTTTGQTRIGQFVRIDTNGSLPGISIATTSPNAYIATCSDIINNPIIDVVNTTNAATGTVQLPSSTAMAAAGCLPAPGDSYTFKVWNASLTSTLTFSAGGSSSLQLLYSAASSTGLWAAQSSTLPARGFAEVNVSRILSSTQPWLLYGYLMRQ